MSPATDVTTRVAVLESTVATLQVDQKDDHDELRELREGLLSINGKLDAIRQAMDDATRRAVDSDPETRIRALEDWRTGLRAQAVLLVFVASIFSAVLTAVAVKWITGAVLPAPQPRVAPLDYNTMPIDRDGAPKWPVR